MVTTRASTRANTVKNLTKTMIRNFFGKTLTLQTINHTVDDFGQLSSSGTSEVSFIGDLQFGTDVDPRLISTGQIEVGEAVLYIDPDALSTIPTPGRSSGTVYHVIDGTSEWSIEKQIESPELGGVVTHYSFKCRREPNSNDS